MPKTWQPNEAKRFARQARLNTPYYIVYDVAQNAAPYEDAHLYSEIIFTRRAPLTGNPMTDGGTSAEGLCLRFGPVHEKPPAGMRNVSTPGPQVAGPVDPHMIHTLDEAEIASLEKQATDAERERRKHATQRARHSWSLFH